MRIGYLTGEYPRATDTFIQREVAGLRDLGVDVQTFSIRRTGDEHIVGPEQAAERERTFYILPPNPIGLISNHLSLFFQSPGRYFKTFKLALRSQQGGPRGFLYQMFYLLEAGILARELQRRKVEHLHNHFPDSSGTVAMLAAALAGITSSFTMHGPYIFFAPDRWRLDIKIQQALFVCCISHFCRSQGMVFAPADCWDRMHIIHCGVDPALFTPVVHQADRQRLLFTGRIASAKGLPVLIEAMTKLTAIHPHVILTIIGDGPDRAAIEARVAQLNLGDNIQFVGYKSQAEVRTYLEHTDVFVLPSFAEGVPVVLMEAMAAGVPVVATRIAGIPELVEDGKSGYLVPPGDAQSLADRLAQLLADAELRSAMGKVGRSKVEQEFTIHDEVKRLKRVMEAALAGKGEAIRPL
jgi:colanic acid/amylovoran biosynthesis glycosyltransferase